MAPSTTRSSTRNPASTQSPPVIPEEPVQLSSPPVTPGEAATKNARYGLRSHFKVVGAATGTGALPPTPKSLSGSPGSAELQKKDVNELPMHSGLAPIPASPSNERVSKGAAPSHTAPSKKRKRQIKSTNESLSTMEENVDELAEGETFTKKKSRKRTKKTSTTKGEDGDLPAEGETSTKKKSKGKKFIYNPSETPYPNHAHPTRDECFEVHRLLTEKHGKVEPPKAIPAPSLTVSGCGEVPSVVDAMCRTRLAANTTNGNAGRALRGLVEAFGVTQEDVTGKGSVDWNKVRLADVKEVVEAIRSGGMADLKGKDIKAILDLVYAENEQRIAALKSGSDVLGSLSQTPKEKTLETEKLEKDMLNLDYLHALPTIDAFNALVKYPGIGVKTAACVLMFCLKRPVFAVDTHVFRLSKWLGWVPLAGDPAGLPLGAKQGKKFGGPTPDSTFQHLESMVPDELKYPLHQLFIFHGKECPRCRAITGENSEGWDKGCIIEELVQRTGLRKGPKAAGDKKTMAKWLGGEKKEEEEVEEEIQEEDAEIGFIQEAGLLDVEMAMDETKMKAEEEDEADYRGSPAAQGSEVPGPQDIETTANQEVEAKTEDDVKAEDTGASYENRLESTTLEN